MTTQECNFDFSQIQERFLKIIELNCYSGFKIFRKILRGYLIFHSLAWLLLISLSLCVYLFSGPLYNLSFLSIFIALLALTSFTYLALIFYFQSKKTDQLTQLTHWYVSILKKSIGGEFSYLEHYLALAGGLYFFSHYLNPKAMPLYKLKIWLPSLQKVVRKLALFIYVKDFHKLKEMLMLSCIKQHLTLLKYEPTHLEVHGSLANSYLSLSKIYKYSRDHELLDNFSLDDLSEESKIKFKNTIAQAIEEYQIIEDFLPKDPWVLMQLALCYHELEDYDHEIYYFEKILESSDNNYAVMMRLAQLYFSQKKHAKGFKLYKILRENSVEGVELLIEDYIETALS